MVMASLAEREGLRGKVQCIFMDPPYGIKFGSNWQVSTRSTEVRDGKVDQISLEPEMIKAFRDTWSDGIHSYMSYLRDRLTVSRELLCSSGSIFVQIGDENVHRVRNLLDEVYGAENYVGQISFRTKIPLGTKFLPSTFDYILWYAKDKEHLKFRRLFVEKKEVGNKSNFKNLQLEDTTRRGMTGTERDRIVALPKGSKAYSTNDLNSAGLTRNCVFNFDHEGKEYGPRKNRSWKTNSEGMARLAKAYRLGSTKKNLYYVYFYNDYPVQQLENIWTDTGGGVSGKTYVVQTSEKVVQRCLLMASDPGDLVLESDLWRRNDCSCGREMGKTMDHDRHVPSSLGSCPYPLDGHGVSVLSTCRLNSRERERARVVRTRL